MRPLFFRTLFLALYALLPHFSHACGGTLHIVQGPKIWLCPGDTVLLRVGVSGMVFGTFHWSNGATTDYLEVTAPGTYSVWNTDGCNEASTEVVLMTTSSMGDSATKLLCPGEPLELHTGWWAPDYLWNDGSTVHPRSITMPGDYAVEAIGSCASVTYTFHVDLFDSTRVVMPTLSICAGETLMIPCPIGTTPFGADLCEWAPGSYADSAMVTAPGMVEVVGLVPCRRSYWIPVLPDIGCRPAFSQAAGLIGPESACQPFISNVFTPNGDGLNDAFRAISNCELSRFRLRVMDMRGSLLWESGSVAGSWDGSVEGKAVPEGMYVWQMEYAGEKTSGQDAGLLMLLR